MDIKISVIMGVYNSQSREVLDLAVNSIINQSFPEWELIICNDGSKEEVSRWLSEITYRDDRIKLIENKTNSGLSIALNRCLEIAKGKYIARMDDDDISLPERLQEEYDFLEEHQEYAFVGCNVDLINKKEIWGELKMIERPLAPDFLFNSPFAHPTILVRKEIYLKLNGYNTSDRCTRVEDYDFFMRLYEKGYYGYNLQKKLYQYRVDKEAYKKRKYRYRINEARVRYHGFGKLGLMPNGLPYVIKPLIVGLLPTSITRYLRQRMN